MSMLDISKAQLIMLIFCDYYAGYLSSVNLSSRYNYPEMEFIESIGWIVLGFAPTLAAMEVAWRIGRRRLAFAEVGAS